MKKRLSIMLVFGIAIAVLVGSLLWMADDESLPNILCNELSGIDEGDPLIVARGAFGTHHENLAYIGDEITFDLAVVYNNEQISVTDRAIRNFEIDPFALVSIATKVVEETHGVCTVKEVQFVIRVLNVSIGSLNTLQYLDSDGIARIPDVTYSAEGKQHRVYPVYDPLFVASLIGQKPIMPRDIPYAPINIPLPDEGFPLSALGNLIAGVGVLSIAAASLYVYLFKPFENRDSSVVVRKQDVLRKHFPGLFVKDNPRKALTSLYHGLGIYLDRTTEGALQRILEDCKSSASRVFKDDGQSDNKEEFAEALSFIRGLLETSKSDLEEIEEGGEA